MGISGSCMYFINPSWTNSLAIKQGEKFNTKQKVSAFVKWFS